MKVKKEVEFSPELRQKLESGEAYAMFKDEDGVEVKVKVICWDAGGEYPVIVIPDKEDSVPFRVTENGKPMRNHSNPEITVIVKEDLNSFEQAVYERLKKYSALTNNFSDEALKSFAKEDALVLLEAAKKELGIEGKSEITAEDVIKFRDENPVTFASIIGPDLKEAEEKDWKKELREIICKARTIAKEDKDRVGGMANTTAYEFINKLYLALTV